MGVMWPGNSHLRCCLITFNSETVWPHYHDQHGVVVPFFFFVKFNLRCFIWRSAWNSCFIESRMSSSCCILVCLHCKLDQPWWWALMQLVVWQWCNRYETQDASLLQYKVEHLSDQSDVVVTRKHLWLFSDLPLAYLWLRCFVWLLKLLSSAAQKHM